MERKVYAYMRISTGKQEHARQKMNIDEYAQANGILIDEYVEDVVSGKLANSKREPYMKMKEQLKEGDVVIIDAVDRLGRDLLDTQEEYLWYLRNNVNLFIVEFPLLNINFRQDSTTEDTFVKQLMIQVFTYTAQKEREKISERTKQGLRARKLAGVKLGRPTEHNHEKVMQYMEENPSWTYKEVQDKFDISSTSVIHNIKRKLEERMEEEV